jgi:hypothetical protein
MEGCNPEKGIHVIPQGSDLCLCGRTSRIFRDEASFEAWQSLLAASQNAPVDADEGSVDSRVTEITSAPQAEAEPAPEGESEPSPPPSPEPDATVGEDIAPDVEPEPVLAAADAEDAKQAESTEQTEEADEAKGAA